MKLAAPIVAMLVSVACVTTRGQSEWVEPSFISGLGVIVQTFDPEYLTPEMVAVMEDDLVEQFSSKLSRADLTQCLLGVQAKLDSRAWWMCQTPDQGEIPCVGSTDGRWRVRVAHHGRCAYTLGSHGPTYEHELVHIVHKCFWNKIDRGHVEPVWDELNYERACP